MSTQLILASGSVYRSQSLARLAVPFEAVAAGIDETAKNSESPSQLSRRLALEKASAVAAEYPRAAVIGADQCASLNGRILGKPGDRKRAFEQLAAASGNTVDFFTAVRVLIPGRGEGLAHLDRTRVVFRELSRDEIERYLDHDRPYDCAGAFRVEALGISLFDRVESDDPTALIGLPLIALARLLREAGFAIP